MGHGHLHLHKRQDEGGLTTIDGQVYSVTYVTASPTFDGVIGGYTTLTGGSSTQAAQTTSGSRSQSTTGPEDDGIPDAATALPRSSSSSSSTAASTSIASSTGSAAGVATPSSSATASSSASDGGMSTGTKAGLAIGIIAGIGLIAAILLFCIGRKKKQKKEREARGLDEKTTFGASRNAINMQNTSPISTAGPAPRLSIRPMSRNLLGDFGFGGSNRRSAGNMLNNIAESTPRNGSPAAQNRPQSPPENPFADPKNPFADPERGAPVMAAAPKKVAPPVAAPMGPPPVQNPDRIAFTGSWPAAPTGYERQAPVSLPEPTAAQPPKPSPAVSRPDDLPIMGTTPSLAPSSPAPGSSAVVGGAALAAGAAAAVAASSHSGSRPEQRRTEPQQQPRDAGAEQPRQQVREQIREQNKDLAGSPGPAPSPAFAAAGGPPSSPNPSLAGSTASQQGGNVYRVLMDFAPSMDDELELKAGTLVRLLHEYDDGWALCIRLDRSHQGVVPRTCLAAKPSKPKPSHLGQYARGPGQNGRDSPMGRPQSPAGDPRGRNSPAMGRPMSPGMGRPMSPGMGRPMSPAGGPPMRPMSPAGRQMRPQSPAGGHRGPPRGGPPGGHGPNRPMSPAGGFNQAPRPLSPGPMRSPGMPPKRSQSPGPYGAAGPLPMPSAPQRRRSNSASAANFQDRRMSPPGPSKLGMGMAL